MCNLQTSSIEIERVCDIADESIWETAAVSVAPVGGGPELLAIFVALKKGFNVKPDKLKTIFSKAIQRNLNPLFKVCCCLLLSKCIIGIVIYIVLFLKLFSESPGELG